MVCDIKTDSTSPMKALKEIQAALRHDLIQPEVVQASRCFSTPGIPKQKIGNVQWGKEALRVSTCSGLHSIRDVLIHPGVYWFDLKCAETCSPLQ